MSLAKRFRMVRLTLFALLVSCAHIASAFEPNAAFSDWRSPRVRRRSAGVDRCLEDVATRTERCWRLQSLPGLGRDQVPRDGVEPRFLDVRVSEVGFNPDETFVVRVEWFGRGTGPLGLSGLHGTMFGTGHILRGDDGAAKFWFTEVSDLMVSEVLDRGLVFNALDAASRKRHTLEWLNQVIAPYVEARLTPTTITRP